MGRRTAEPGNAGVPAGVIHGVIRRGETAKFKVFAIYSRFLPLPPPGEPETETYDVTFEGRYRHITSRILQDDEPGTLRGTFRFVKVSNDRQGRDYQLRFTPPRSGRTASGFVRIRYTCHEEVFDTYFGLRVLSRGDQEEAAGLTPPLFGCPE